MRQVTYKVARLDGSNPVQFDHENEAREYARKAMAEGCSVYLLRQTSKFLSLFDARAGEQVEHFSTFAEDQ